MKKDRYAVGVVTGPIHFLSYNPELYFEEPIDTIARITYKYPILPGIMGIDDPISLIAEVILEGEWTRFRPAHQQIWFASKALVQKAKALALESRRYRIIGKGPMPLNESEERILLPLHGE